MTYKEAEAKLHGRCRDRRKLANNTWLERRAVNVLAVRLHNTDILSFDPDGSIEVRTDGWNSVTTYERMNRYLPSPWRVRGGSRGWRGYTTLGKDWSSGNEVVRYCTISPAGELLDAGQSIADLQKELREAANERNRPRARARYWTAKARGRFVDRSACTEPRQRCGSRGWDRRLPRNQVLDGTLECGCVCYTVKPTYRGTVESILAEENMTVRAAKMQCYGFERFFLDAKAVTLDEQAGYSLLEIPSRQHWQNGTRAVQMECPSTGQIYINPVPPSTSTVPEALDWIFNTKDYLGTVTQQT